MAYIILFTVLTLIISFLTGVLTIHKFKINLKYVTFALPIGTLVLFGILQIFYMSYSYLVRLCNLLIPTNSLTKFVCDNQPIILIGITIFIPLLITLIFIKNFSKCKEIIKKQFSNKWKLFIALVIFVIFLFIFINTQVPFRTDDMNFYGPYISDKINNTGNSMILYDYQGFFVYLSALINSVSFLPSLGRFSNALPLGYIEWIPTIIMMVCFSLTIADFIDFIKEKITNKYLVYFVYITTIILVYIDYWYTVYPYFGNTLRRLSIIYILYFLYEQIKGKFDFKYLLMILFGSYFFFSSTSFFISAFIAYGYILYSMKLNRRGYLKEICICYLIPFLFLLPYISSLSISIPLQFSAITVFVLLIFIFIIMKNNKIELILNKCYKFILFGVSIIVIILTFVFEKQIDYAIMFGMGSRQFFSAINLFDMVPDIVNGDITSSLFTLGFNAVFWLLVGMAIIKVRKSNNFFIYLILITVLTFFNPFVYKFICGLITSAAYFRITDIFYNIVVLGSVFIILVNTDDKVFKYIVIGLMTCLVVLRLTNIEITKFIPEEEMNIQYRVPQVDYEAVKNFENNILQFNDKESYNVISHVYGLENLTKYKVDNLLEDRFAYIYINDGDEFQTMFARRYPGYNLPEVSYEKACTLAFERDVEYVILDAQYNWMLQEGLWPCSVVVDDYGIYRVLKMDYEYWESNIKLGYVEDYR